MGTIVREDKRTGTVVYDVTDADDREVADLGTRAAYVTFRITPAGRELMTLHLKESA